MTSCKALAAAALTTLILPASALAVSGGTDAPAATAPYMAWLGGHCTGTLITPTRILTAAHCVDGASASEVRVLVGVDGNLLNDKQSTAAALPVRGFSAHPGFGEAFPFAHDSPANAIAVNDVGLILLKRPVTGVKPIRVAGPGDGALQAAGAALTLFGYGATGPPPSSKSNPPAAPSLPLGSQGLQNGALSVISPRQCAESYPGVITPKVLCTRDLATHRPLVMACAGDSGGPVVASTPDGPVQVGVTSWGAEVKNGVCGDSLLPNVPMRVAAFSSFITQAEPVIEPYTANGKAGGLGSGAVAHVAGVARVGKTVSCTPPKLAGDPFKLSYAWAVVRKSGFVDLKGAHGHRLRITPAIFHRAFRLSRRLSCTVFAGNAGGTLKVNSGSVPLKR